MDNPSELPIELQLAGHIFCDLTKRPAKDFTDDTKTVQHWESAAIFCGNVLTAQRALYLASKQINEEEAAAKQSQNGGEPEFDLDSIPDPQVILVQ